MMIVDPLVVDQCLQLIQSPGTPLSKIVVFLVERTIDPRAELSRETSYKEDCGEGFIFFKRVERDS